ncbi:MAG: NADH-quinone oxidoreductase subunit J [Ekhidna sp.]
MTLIIQIGIGLMTLAGVLIILFTRNVVHAAYALALALLGMAGVYVFLDAELLAVVQILLYAGGVVILLIFGVMMTNRVQGGALMSEGKNRVLSGFIAVGLFTILCFYISSHSFDKRKRSINSDQVEQIGISFLTEHIVAFELVAFILLVALVGAAYLAKMSSDD